MHAKAGRPEEAKLRLAAARGHRGGLCALEYVLDGGWGVAEDDATGLRVYQAAALAGADQCMFDLGVCYRDGRGAPRDPLAAYVWFTLADRGAIAKASVKAANMRRLLQPEQLAEAERRLAEWGPAAE